MPPTDSPYRLYYRGWDAVERKQRMNDFVLGLWVLVAIGAAWVCGSILWAGYNGRWWPR